MTDANLQALLDLRDNFSLLELQVRNEPKLLPELMELGLYSSHRNSWRALYLAEKLHGTNPESVRPYLDKMIEQLKVESHHGKRRILLKLISINEISRDHFGFLLPHCMDTLTQAKEPVANRVHAMQILYNISEEEPELKPELIDTILHEMEYHATPGIRARGKNLLKKLRKQIPPR